MAEAKPFNYKLDKITEREVVYDFVSRLSIGKDFINKDYDKKKNSIDKKVILPEGMMLKDGVINQIIRTLFTSDILNLDTLKTSFKAVYKGDKQVSFTVPEHYKLYKIVQEKTGQNVTACFKLNDSGDTYTTIFNTPMTNDDIFKAYFCAEDGYVPGDFNIKDDENVIGYSINTLENPATTDAEINTNDSVIVTSIHPAVSKTSSEENTYTATKIDE